MMLLIVAFLEIAHVPSPSTAAEFEGK